MRKALAGAVTLANVYSGPINGEASIDIDREDIGNTGRDVMLNDGTGKLRDGRSDSLASWAGAGASWAGAGASWAGAGSATCSTSLEGQRSLLSERTRRRLHLVLPDRACPLRHRQVSVMPRRPRWPTLSRPIHADRCLASISKCCRTITLQLPYSWPARLFIDLRAARAGLSASHQQELQKPF
jgi:hypothetical protein